MEISNCGSSYSTFNQTGSKNLKMREFIEAVNEYLQMKTENSAFIIKKCLQAFSVSIDVSIFDPDASLGAQFFVSLYELFNKQEPQSPISWDCVEVLINACRNCAARQALINTYSFVPSLSRLLSDQLSDTKRKRILKLMQDLTCGIKISWQIPHLPHLLKTLTQWVKDKDEETVTLSLGVLVNVLYKNLPAIYTFSRIADGRNFLRYCLPLKGPQVEILVCKLMIIVDHCVVPEKTLINLIEPTFSSIQESLTKNDPVMLRVVVEFFTEMVTSEYINALKEYQHYNEQLSRLIQLLNARSRTNDLENTTPAENDPECVLLVLKFIYILEVNQLGNLSSLYPKISKFALDWVHSETVSHQSFLLLTEITQKVIVMNDGGEDRNILQLLIVKLSAFLTTLTSEVTVTSMQSCRRLGSLLQLLRAMFKSPSIRNEVLQIINENIINKIFSPVLTDELHLSYLPKLRTNESSTTSTDVIDTYVYALALVHDLSQYDASWLEILGSLMENIHLQEILGHALCGSDIKVKQLVLEISKYPRFPAGKVALVMQNLQDMFYSAKGPKKISNGFNADVGYPIISSSQMEIVDEALKKVKSLMRETDPGNVTTNQVMDLYEYKLASLAHAERCALNSIEASTERCVHLQHRLAQLTSEHNKLRQNLYQSEYRIEKFTKDIREIQRLNLISQEQAELDLAKLRQIITDNDSKIKELQLKLLEMTDQKNGLEEKVVKCEQLIKKLEENGCKVEKLLQKRTEQLNNANLHIDTLNLQKQDLETILKQKESKLAEVTKQYVASKEIINTITKVANSQLP